MVQLTLEQAFHIALQHHQAGRLEQAEALYTQVLSRQPNHADALHLLGVIACQRGRNDIAVALIRRAVTISPGYAEAHSNLGVALKNLGRLDEAIAAFRQAIALKPTYPDAHSNLGNALSDNGQLDEAVAACHQAIALKPDYPEAYNNLGNALADRKQFDDAVAAYRQAIALNPDYADAYSNLCSALSDKGQTDEAIAACRKAIALNSELAEAYGNLGVALRDKGQFDEAMAAHRRAVALKPDWPKAHNNLANALREEGQLDQAIAACRQAIALRPPYPEARLNLAMALLLKGEFAQGWDEYEWRWKCADFPMPVRFTDHPRWDGSDLPRQTLLVHAEQGLGDSLQFIRYVPAIVQRGLRVIVEAPAAVLPLLRTVDGVADAHPTGAMLPPFDVQLPMLSLPFVFGTTLENIPADVPYLKADRKLAQAWAAKLRWDKGLKVGLAWAGNPANKNNHFRSVSLAALAPLGAVPGVTFYSLQKGPAADQAARPPVGMKLIDWTGELNDFGDTAALVSCLDLIISVDTAVAHLAGGMGKPVWTLLWHAPDFRWLLDRTDNPWYPTMRVFRQPSPLQWEPAIQTLAAELTAWAGQHEATARSKPEESVSRGESKALAAGLTQPQWSGGVAAGRTILIHCERGLRDTIQFIRYVPLVLKRGAKVMVLCQPELRQLLEGQWDVQWLVPGQPLPPFDLHCPLMSLPLTLGATVKNIPHDVPYAHAAEASVQKWGRILGRPGSVRVGLTWAGSGQDSVGHERSVPLSLLAPLARVRGVKLYHLQKGPAAARQPPAGMKLIDLTNEIHDLSDTAALIANLDLVISVDSSVAHLAGAMARPVWTLLSVSPGWLWQLGDQESPWYPTMRLFRQPRRGDWQSVIDQVVEELALVGSKPRSFDTR